MANEYVLPELPYAYNALQPYISEEQLRFHHDKHHQAYVKAANSILEKIQLSRKMSGEIDIKAIAREFSFNVSGHILHSLFWENLQAPQKDNLPNGDADKILKQEFGSYERFKEEFSKAALSAEGSAWAVLAACPVLKRPIIMQVEKHSLYINPASPILLVLDVWEHAYYIDYKNERAKFVEGFWNIINWEMVNKRIKEM
jgi:Fe-Mn family superoxide dismutase